ncbi:uncharacterized protein LOC132903249 [Amyelois transitella]|uniref:uncharacterized protein LOC132903249 n=1 Tax=Amyelois transitella TaxID=680683 RepID=UPI00298F4906|nr:uncharacterized protein LOC132903249 [Amyelois transitella]
MADRRSSSVLTKQTLLTRGGRILALVPAENAPSDDSERSDVEEEFRVRTPLSSFSSPAPSIHSSLERLNILDDDEHYNSDNVPLTPIFQTVYSSPSLEPNCNKVPVLSDIPSLPTTPLTPVNPPNPKTRSRRRQPTVPVRKRPRLMKKFTLNYQWKKAVFRHRAIIEEDSNYTDVPDISALDYFYKFFSPDILTDIVEQTNFYSKNPRNCQLDYHVKA